MAAAELAIAAPNYAVALLVLVACFLLIQSTARELRPSDHGLEYQQESQPAGDGSPPGMLTFFGASPSNSPPPPVALPNATNSTDNSWLSVGHDSRSDKERVREILLIASLVCGITGVALLLASALLLLLKFRKENRSESTATVPPLPLPPPPPTSGVSDIK